MSGEDQGFLRKLPASLEVVFTLFPCRVRVRSNVEKSRSDPSEDEICPVEVNSLVETLTDLPVEAPDDERNSPSNPGASDELCDGGLCAGFDDHAEVSFQRSREVLFGPEKPQSLDINPVYYIIVY